MGRDLGLDGVVEHFTLVGDEPTWLRNKSGATRLGFSAMLKFLLWKGRFPRGRFELPDDAVDNLARHRGPDAITINARRTRTDSCFPRRTICCNRRPSSSLNRRALTGSATRNLTPDRDHVPVESEAGQHRQPGSPSVSPDSKRLPTPSPE